MSSQQRRRPNEKPSLARVLTQAFYTLFFSVYAVQLTASEADTLKSVFRAKVKPFVNEFCIDCHGDVRPKAKFSLTPFQTIDSVVDGHQYWDLVLEKLVEREMPPEDADHLPKTDQVDEIIRWYRELQKAEAQRNDGDPGPVLARRLSNAEYNYSIEDLTGVAIQPTKDFPIDSANQEGFDNSGESLNLSPGLLNKYLQAARKVTEHLVLTPSGLTWSSHPTVTETDRDKYAVLRIVDFYQRQPTHLADYFLAAWEQARSKMRQDLSVIADQEEVSPKYLKAIWDLLHGPTEAVGPILEVVSQWRQIPSTCSRAEARSRCDEIERFIRTVRRQIEPKVRNLEGGTVHRGSQSYVLWKNRQYELNRRSYDPTALMTPSELKARKAAAERAIEEAKKDQKSRSKPSPFRAPHPALILPEDTAQHEAYHRAFKRFANIFPDAFYLSERGRDYVGKEREKQEKGRLLSAGFHSMMGYYRDDQPLYDLILNDAERSEIDRLWDELDFITQAPKRQFIGFLWFERTDSRYMTDPVFDFARAEHEDATEETKIKRLATVYLNKADEKGAPTQALQAIERYFEGINGRIRWLEEAESQAEHGHLTGLLRFAERAFRRPLHLSEQNDLLNFYQGLRFKDELSHQEALRETVASLLVSPHFFYRVHSSRPGKHPERAPLTDFALASRLSYFLWSSIPDEPLLKAAQAGELRESDGLNQQVRRMIADPRVRRLAIEFGANWLDFRRFESHNAVDRNRFPEFDNQLRQSMFEEPIQFLVDVMQHNRSLSALLYGEHTFANPSLAEHYGFPNTNTDERKWIRFDRAVEFGRGGILPMAAFLTINAPGLRTSPVKRGYWVARRVLGETIPPPPPDVPEIPSDESALGNLTLPQILAKHREHPNCAACHDRFDSLGLVFEGFGPVGERRTHDLGNRPVSTTAVFPNGQSGKGLAGLKHYIRNEREVDFYRNLCRKLLAYALGRSLQMSDGPLVERMLAKLALSDYRFSVLIESIVSSDQFLMMRKP